jgi:hypothetical protein
MVENSIFGKSDKIDQFDSLKTSEGTAIQVRVSLRYVLSMSRKGKKTLYAVRRHDQVGLERKFGPGGAVGGGFPNYERM